MVTTQDYRFPFFRNVGFIGQGYSVGSSMIKCKRQMSRYLLFGVYVIHKVREEGVHTQSFTHP